jgi:hypothetical protein
MEIRTSTPIVVLFVVLFLIGIATALYGQEAVETAPETTITEETATTTPTTPRIVSQELLTELKASQAALEDAQKIIQYVLGKIIQEYQVDIRTEVININTGEITPRTTE